MIRSFVITAMSAAALFVSTAAPAQQTEGTAVEARAMLTKAVASVKEDKTKALDMFNKGGGGFRDRDLYVFCHSISDAKLVATGNPNRKREPGRGGGRPPPPPQIRTCSFPASGSSDE